LANVATSGSGWQFFCATYDGSSSSAGITLYDGSGPLWLFCWLLCSYERRNGRNSNRVQWNSVLALRWSYRPCWHR
jgi:hypothetical protein